MKLEISGQVFEKYPNTKFHYNPSNVSRVVPCGRTDMTKLTVAFRYSADATTNTVRGMETGRDIKKNAACNRPKQ